ncbi:MAG TPA: ABC transporter permease, partial [Candidatus Limnocylindrales bacterium]
FGLLCALQEALSTGVRMAGVDRLVTRHKVSIIQMLPIAYQQRIAAIPGVSAVVEQTWFNGIYQDPKNFFMSVPVDPEAYLAMYPELVLPPAQKQAWQQTRTGAVVGRALAERFGWKLGDKIPLHSPIWQRNDKRDYWEFDLVGIYDGAKKGTDTARFFFRYDYFDEGRLARAKGLVSWYTIRVQDPAQAARIAARIDQEFANSDIETKTEPEGAFAQGFAQQIGDVATIVVAILGAVFFTILLVAGNTVAQAIRERTEEIGVLKALGFRNELVLALVLAESCLIAGLGGALGLGFAWVLTLGGSPVPSLLPTFFLPTSNLLLGAGLIVVLGLVTGALPALQAMRLGVADALRRQA